MKLSVHPAIAALLVVATPSQSQESITPVPRLEAYESWKMAKPGDPASVTPATTIQAPEGFAVELVRAAQEGEDSWVGMAFDDTGRLYLGMEQKGILRLTLDESNKVTKTETVDEELEECRGLLWAHNALYANANDSKGFFRLRDTNGDDLFDEKKLLLATTGGVGHGRNHLRLGPDGMIYLVHGNDPLLDPADEAPQSPFKNWGEDQLIPNPWDDSWNKIPAPAGYILRTDKDGTQFERLCGGLRNSLDMDFNRAGEMFVYDADSEWDAALAWYKPTRVLHIVSGGEYGWRRGTGKWPAYYPDSLESVVDIGLGSPTGVGFGYESNFPEKWREAFYIADWSYGQLIAVHMSDDGASYSGEKEVFLSGRPLNLTDFIFHDGDLWFITGGRRTQSALYRVSWTGETSKSEPAGRPASSLQKLRHELEKYHTEQSEVGLELALRNLDHKDRFIRFAARVALENQPVDQWKDIVLENQIPDGLLALARVGKPNTQAALIDALCAAAQQGSVTDHPPSGSALLTLLRTFQLSFIRQGEPDAGTREQVIATLDPLYPGGERAIDHELCELLVYLRAEGVIDTTLTLLENSDDTRDWSHYLVFLRYVENGWTTESRRRYLKALRRFEEFPGGRWYVRTAQDLRTEAVASLTDPQRKTLADLLTPALPAVPDPPITVDPAVFVKDWTMEDFSTELKNPQASYSREAGRLAYHKAGCAACHRMGDDAATTNAILGPDLTEIGARFDARAMLESIIHPSRVIGDKYRNPAGPNISLMPPGLINGLEKSEVLQLLTYLRKDRPQEETK